MVIIVFPSECYNNSGDHVETPKITNIRSDENMRIFKNKVNTKSPGNDLELMHSYEIWSW